MSIIASLKRLFDPITHREEEDEKKAERELTPTDAEGEPPQFSVPVAREQRKADGKRYRCRACGRLFKKKQFCSNCLADSVAPVR